jgi:hypothetical protein
MNQYLCGMASIVRAVESSDDEDVSQDTFGLESIRSTKKAKVDDDNAGKTIIWAAPNILAEAGSSFMARHTLITEIGSLEPNITSHKADGYSDECEHTLQRYGVAPTRPRESVR